MTSAMHLVGAQHNWQLPQRTIKHLFKLEITDSKLLASSKQALLIFYHQQIPKAVAVPSVHQIGVVRKQWSENVAPMVECSFSSQEVPVCLHSIV